MILARSLNLSNSDQLRLQASEVKRVSLAIHVRHAWLHFATHCKNDGYIAHHSRVEISLE